MNEQLKDALDLIVSRINQIEGQIVNCAGSFYKGSFGVDKVSGTWRLVHVDGHEVKPVAETKITTRLEFAEQSVDFVRGYQAHCRATVEVLEHRARAAAVLIARAVEEAEKGVSS